MGNDINQRVIEVQKREHWDVGPQWYDKYVTRVVGGSASEDEMFSAFMQAFEQHFPVGPDGTRQADDEALRLGAKPV